MALILNKLKYKEFERTVCGDLKVISMILRQQEVYTKFPWTLCEGDSHTKAKHWSQEMWLKRTLKVGEKNVHFESLVDPKNVLLRPLHIKLGTMKQKRKLALNTFQASLLVCLNQSWRREFLLVLTFVSWWKITTLKRWWTMLRGQHGILLKM